MIFWMRLLLTFDIILLRSRRMLKVIYLDILLIDHSVLISLKGMTKTAPVLNSGRQSEMLGG